MTTGKKVYTLSSNHDGIIGVYSNKKELFNSMNRLSEDNKGHDVTYKQLCNKLSKSGIMYVEAGDEYLHMTAKTHLLNY